MESQTITDPYDEEQEPLEYVPSETYSNTGVVCPVCSAVHPIKRHFSSGKFSAECPSCRRRTSNKVAQKRFRVRAGKAAEVARAKLHAQFLAVIKLINSRVNKLMAQAKQQQKRMAEKIAEGDGNKRAHRALLRREAQISYYERVRECMLADATRDQLKPLEHYLQDEELYAQYVAKIARINEPATAKPGVGGVDEPEGVE
jgi:hypothetical protein